MEQLHTLAQTVALGDIAPLRQQLEKAMLLSGGDPEAVADMILALNEAIVNSVRHGYRGQPGEVQIEIWRAGRSLVVKHIDAAPLFDPTAVPSPDVTLPIDLRPLGGMGILMMRHFTDELRYEQTPNGRNQLTFTKHNTFI